MITNKTFSLILCPIVCLLSLVYQATLHGQTVVWEHRYKPVSSSNYFRGISISPTAGGGYLLTGLTFHNGEMLCLYPDGSINWRREFPGFTALDGGYRDVFSITAYQSTSTEYRFVGIAAGFTTSGELLIAVTDTAGNLLHDNFHPILITIPAYADLNGTKTYRMPNNGFVIVGGTNATATTNGHIDLDMSDSIGNFLGERSISTDTNAPSIGTTLRFTKDGGYLIRTNLQHNYKSIGVPYIVKTDTAFVKQWDIFIRSDTALLIGDAIETYDGGFAAVGIFSVSGSGMKSRTYSKLFKFSKDRDLEWEHTFEVSGKRSTQAYQLVQMPDSGYVLCGNVGQYKTDTALVEDYNSWDVFVLGLTKSGYKRWEKILEVPGMDDMGAFISAPDGDVIVTGFTRQDTSLYIAKIKGPTSGVRPESTGGVPEILLSAYPTPATGGVVHLRLQSQDPAGTEIRICNALGQDVLGVPLHVKPGQDCPISIVGLPTGLYYMRGGRKAEQRLLGTFMVSR